MTNDLLTLILGIFRLSLTLLYRMPFCNPIHDPRVTYFDCSRTRTTHNTNRCSHIHTSHTHISPIPLQQQKKKKNNEWIEHTISIARSHRVHIPQFTMSVCLPLNCCASGVCVHMSLSSLFHYAFCLHLFIPPAVICLICKLTEGKNDGLFHPSIIWRIKLGLSAAVRIVALSHCGTSSVSERMGMGDGGDDAAGQYVWLWTNWLRQIGWQTGTTRSYCNYYIHMMVLYDDRGVRVRGHTQHTRAYRVPACMWQFKLLNIFRKVSRNAKVEK